MKPLFILMFTLFMGGIAQAQERSVKTATTTVVVPESVKATFEKEFPGIQARWEADDKNFKATYADPKTNSKGIIIYDNSGQVIRRDTEVAVPKNPE
jgi:hypothetical protein